MDFKALPNGVEHMDVYIALVEDLDPDALESVTGMIRVQGKVTLDYSRLKTKPRPALVKAGAVEVARALGTQVLGRTSEGTL